LLQDPTLIPVMELGSTEAIREAIAAGLGVALVSRHAVLACDRRVVTARLAGPRWTLLIVRPVLRRNAIQTCLCARLHVFSKGSRKAVYALRTLRIPPRLTCHRANRSAVGSSSTTTTGVEETNRLSPANLMFFHTEEEARHAGYYRSTSRG
jgi:hypothetical protein